MSLTTLILFFFFLTIISTIASDLPMSLPNCKDKCGNITIPYAFGIQAGCYRHRFGVTCNETSSKLFLGSSNIQISNINISTGEITAKKFVGYRCFDKSGNVNKNEDGFEGWLRLKNRDEDRSTFLYSAKRNKFTVIGCDALAYINDDENTGYASGCLSFCSDLDSPTNGSCNGMGCCQTAIPKGLSYYNVTWGFDNNIASNFSPCIYATLVEEDWYNFNVTDLIGRNFHDNTIKGVPFVIDWAIRDNGTCKDDTGMVIGGISACVSKHSRCSNTTNGDGYLCQCTHGYEGNPYIIDGCLDIDECESLNIYHCDGGKGACKNTDGDYECICQKGMRGNGKIVGNCTKIPDKFPYPARVSIVSILAAAVLVAVCFLVDACQRRRRHNKEKEEHLKYKEMMAVRVYSKKEIEMATNNFDENLVLGTGGHGKVYRGILENEQVAIKKSKEVKETEREEFVKEISLLSQMNLRNIVRILGCCLEVNVPMLVYEFVSNGSLFDLLHGKRNNQSIPLATRVKIALGSAKALDYLHNSISRPILHGDVKSANILLDNDYTAKVSDFGASSLVPIDGEEIAKLVQGTRGYLDPECLGTGIITKSSDVYSFGVVLLELITRKNAVYMDEITYEKKSLATSFASMASKKLMNEMFDKEIVSGDEKVIEVLCKIGKLALGCLSMRGDDRPTMKEVVEKLQSVVRFNPELFEQRDIEDAENLPINKSSFHTAPTTSAFHSTESSSVMEIEVGGPR